MMAAPPSRAVIFEMPEHSGEKRLICTSIIPKVKINEPVKGLLHLKKSKYKKTMQHVLYLLLTGSECLNSVINICIIIPV